MPDQLVHDSFNKFMELGCKQNATFLLNKELMDHCDEVSAISLAERLGGEDGYALLTSAVKSSLRLAFLNGASSYASYCTNLLFHHFSAGPFYKNMKSSLFSTPHKGSIVNIALDAQREMDHKDVLKGFRTGSTMSLVLPRMSLIDTLNEASDKNVNQKGDSNLGEKSNTDLICKNLGLTLTETDINYIIRIALLILRQNGLDNTINETHVNVYSNPPHPLPESILDARTVEIGDFLIRKHLATSGRFTNISSSDYPDITKIKGPLQLIQKVKKSKRVTVKRITSINTRPAKTNKEKHEEKRRKTVKRETKRIDCYSSDMNACQAVLKPDCSKPKVMKSSGIQKATIDLLVKSISVIKNEEDHKKCLQILEEEDIIKISAKTTSAILRNTVVKATIEFAGVKFKAKVFNGDQYIQFVENNIILKTLNEMPRIEDIVICEEKYKFTPDDFKAATRAQRLLTTGISHLKTIDEMLSSDKFDKSSLVSSAEGKSFISKYLAMNAERLNIKHNVDVIIDSKLHVCGCSYTDEKCKCNIYTTPLHCKFGKQYGLKEIRKMTDIKQNKGEAEMAQVDWLVHFANDMKPGENCVSLVTSGDIDAIVINMFALSFHWPRTPDGKFKNHVFVVLQKPNGLTDAYNIPRIIEILELAWEETFIGAKISVALSLGGNDFLPKFHGMPYLKTVECFMLDHFRKNLLQISREGQEDTLKVAFNSQVYVEFVKTMYCPKHLDLSKFTFDEIRQLSVKYPTTKSDGALKDCRAWLSPSTALSNLAKNAQCLVNYYLCAGHHNTLLPKFLVDGCLRKLDNGEVEYSLGDDTQIEDINTIMKIDRHELILKMKEGKHKKERVKQCEGASQKTAERKRNTTKRKLKNTPQKGERRKLKPLASTPKKTGP